MSQVALITLEGTFASGPDLRQALPLKWSVPLYEAIRSQFRTVALTAADQEIARWWLRREGLADWSSVMCWNHVMTYEEWRIDMVREFLANAWEIGFLLDPDRGVTTAAQSMGVLTLNIGPPLVHPGWQPDDHMFRPWDDVVSTVESRP
jgi:hypothetical protein